MTMDFSAISSWIWLSVGLVIVFVILRFFFHIVLQVFHFSMSFFWHGCATAIVLLAIYYVLRVLHIL
jgi:hypothetical protein